MFTKSKWEEIEEARKILKLPKKTTRKEIIENYRKLAKEYHPDHGGSEELIKKLNYAYEILMEYCDNYLIDLEAKEIDLDPKDWWLNRFGEDPIWGKKR
ncbi:heat shock protein DnaJ domain protein [Thermodesulfobacterium geofontis OPF15]|jgi:curved DNA-binding protein CbpA|uniref:Heat shock protein DnaJ domain protein n=2 Tax=Thermodesulfobacterium geofontis TaxID=1295609 RepID=F8C560_THEGP|nr:J domain-containing protein [Thermodesulfobacterium geofontis]AEH22827.1 heat shock protein DnaJ domain protein [Thermodesulfobacterium geofontis OPF15]